MRNQEQSFEELSEEDALSNNSCYSTSTLSEESISFENIDEFTDIDNEEQLPKILSTVYINRNIIPQPSTSSFRAQIENVAKADTDEDSKNQAIVQLLVEQLSSTMINHIASNPSLTKSIADGIKNKTQPEISETYYESDYY